VVVGGSRRMTHCVVHVESLSFFDKRNILSIVKLVIGKRFFMRSLVILCLLLSSCRVGYVMSSSYYQMELLSKRKKNTKVLEKNKLPAAEAEKLKLIPKMKIFGKRLGLSSTNNYDTIALKWDRTVWNVSGCDPLSFTSASWWFPVVGRITYLGFFTDRAADRWLKKLRKRELDVYKRSAGAYSTLGWFRDPVWPSMLKWDEYELAEVVFHELTHATLWVKGGASFNESFANFVGQQAMYAYMEEKYGKGSKEVEETRREYRDQDKLVIILHQLYKDVDAAFKDPNTTKEEKLKKKKELYDSIGERILASDMEQKERYSKAIQRAPWNNARLMQFKTYNTSEEDFAAILQQQQGDIKAFINEVGRITKKQKKPFVAVEKAANKIRAARPAPVPPSQPTTTPGL
jgi:predicted aminopeptidase